MKQPWEWDEADLLALIRDQAQESLTLDYKAGAALQKTEPKKDEVSKDASAFANSAGGSIVYGMAEANQLPIDGVRINPVDLATQAPGKVAYVVSIPQSPRAPHQAADKKYYKRFNFQ